MKDIISLIASRILKLDIGHRTFKKMLSESIMTWSVIIVLATWAYQQANKLITINMTLCFDLISYFPEDEDPVY